MEYADGRVVKAIQNAGACGKVVQLFCDVEIARVEDHAKHPAGQSEISKQHVIFPQRVRPRYSFTEARHAVVVREEVEEREEDGEWLLHAEEAVEGPFPMELKDRLAVRRVARFADVCDYMLACVVA